MNFVWNATMALGVEAIDREHRHLLNLTNAILQVHTPALLRPLLAQLYKHTREHFAHEEAWMRERGYADRAAHARSHDQLLERLNAISAEVGQGRVPREAIAALMNDWVQGHVLQADRAIVAWAQGAPEKPD